MQKSAFLCDYLKESKPLGAILPDNAHNSSSEMVSITTTQPATKQKSITPWLFIGTGLALTILIYMYNRNE